MNRPKTGPPNHEGAVDCAIRAPLPLATTESTGRLLETITFVFVDDDDYIFMLLYIGAQS